MLTHFVSDAQLTVKTDVSDYAIAGILSITSNNDQLHLVTFYSCTLSVLKLNYDMHNKELLTIYKAFCSWRYYFKGTSLSIDVVTNYKNLEYFSISKTLTHQQTW